MFIQCLHAIHMLDGICGLLSRQQLQYTFTYRAHIEQLVFVIVVLFDETVISHLRLNTSTIHNRLLNAHSPLPIYNTVRSHVTLLCIHRIYRQRTSGFIVWLYVVGVFFYNILIDVFLGYIYLTGLLVRDVFSVTTETHSIDRNAKRALIFIFLKKYFCIFWFFVVFFAFKKKFYWFGEVH